MSENPQEPDRVADEVYEIAEALILDRASQAERQRLEELICRSDEACQAYVQYMQETVAIRQSLAVESARAAFSAAASGSAMVSAQAPIGKANRRVIRWRFGMGVVAVLMLLAAYFLGSHWRQGRAPQVRIARIQQSSQAVWRANGATLGLTTGDWLPSGRYELVQGVAQLRFPWGTDVSLEAPAEIEFSADGMRRLLRGQLVAKVSEEDTGFTIDTPTVQIVDLGTEFGVSAAANGDSEVHVFKGSIEARHRYGDRSHASSPMMLAAGQATMFGHGDDPAQEILYNPRRFSRAWRVVNRIANTEGGMQNVHPPPASVVEGHAESNEKLLLFQERESVVLPVATAVSITHPDLHTTFADQTAWLPANIEVDSYLIHFDPVGRLGSEASVTVQGSVTFDRRILGVIVRGDQLGATDATLGAPDTEYVAPTEYSKRGGRGFLRNALPPISRRGLTGIGPPIQYPRQSTAPNDSIRFSRDRRTLTVTFEGDGAAEHIRVLVATRSDEDSPALADPPLGASRPYRGRPIAVGETIQAEDFDLGGPEIGYRDDTFDLLANAYRTRESVEIYSYLSEDRSANVVCCTTAGEWMAYTVDVAEAGTYVVKASVRSGVGGGRFRFEFGEDAATESLTVPNTGEVGSAFPVDTFVTVQSNPVTLLAGRQVMRLYLEQNHERGWVGDFDWFRIVPAPTRAESTGESAGTID